jgi:hypothetical protein
MGDLTATAIAATITRATDFVYFFISLKTKNPGVQARVVIFFQQKAFTDNFSPPALLRYEGL